MSTLAILLCLAILTISANANVQELTTKTFSDTINDGNEEANSSSPPLPTKLVFFYAPWCGHCEKFHPIYEEIASELTNLGHTVAKVDAIKEQPLESEKRATMIHDLILKMSSCECCFHSLWCSCVYGLSLLLVRREVRTLLFERGTRTPTPTLTGRCSSTCGTTMNAGHTNACCARAQASLQWVAKINAFVPRRIGLYALL